ncbi:MAG: pyrroline-5-carboxylate reductase [Clostridia bacterium]|nr:pyrroline-5-carboxylate reductase [Clostridia bacterium]
MNIGFIGAGGNIAGAIINGIFNSQLVDSKQLFMFDPNREPLKKFEDLGANICDSAKDVVNNSDYIFLCVKPQIIFDIISGIKQFVTAQKCIVSVAAGISIASIKQAVGFDCKVIRVMPNTPLMLSQGASGVSCLPPVSDDEFDFVLNIFKTSGVAVACDENQINAVTAVSGSGPAYVFKFAKAVIEQSVQLGLEQDKAAELMYQTLIGAAYMLRDSGKSADELIKMVTSPKGTTLAALEYFDSKDFDNIVKGAVNACKNRADELGASK